MSAVASGSQRAAQVCRLCKARKKACDKALPACTYCHTRGATCTYDDDSRSATQARSSSAVTSILAVRSVFPFQGFDSNSAADTVPPLDASSPSAGDPDSTSLARTLHVQVTNILQSLDLTPENVYQRYFRCFHSSLPIVAPPTFQEAVNSENVPPATISLLLLAMCLVTQPPPTDTLYMAVRMLWTSLNVSAGPSVTLTQVSLLVATYEYGRGWLDAADVSVGICTRMGCSLRLDEGQLALIQVTEKLEQLKAIESWNLWWSIVVLETIVYVEIGRHTSQHVHMFPPAETMPPIDLDQTMQGGVDYFSYDSATDAKGVTAFGCEVQAVRLLNRVWTATRTGMNAYALMEVDEEIQSFLAWILAEDRTHHSHACHTVSIAIAVRCFFILHQHLIASVAEDFFIPPAEAATLTQRAQAALSTVTKMVIDAAQDHASARELSATHALPLCCRANVQDAKSFLASTVTADGTSDGLRQLANIENGLTKRWG